MASQAISTLENENLLAHAISLPKDGAWTNWLDSVEPLDLSWKNLIYGPDSKLISFMLNATNKSVITPLMLKLMEKSDSEKCCLCGAPKCTLFHILVNCKESLEQKRYTWRHDSILATLQPILLSHIQQHNESRNESQNQPSVLLDHFIREGDVKNWKSKKLQASNLLKKAFDWELLVDFDCKNIIFPPFICATNMRPDIVLFSRSSCQVILLELTCPAEENINKAQDRKIAKYLELQELIKNSSKDAWSSKLFTIELGAREFVANSVRKCLRSLGIPSRVVSTTCRAVSMVSARCSYAIWLKHNTTYWEYSTELNHLVTIPVLSDENNNNNNL